MEKSNLLREISELKSKLLLTKENALHDLLRKKLLMKSSSNINSENKQLQNNVTSHPTSQSNAIEDNSRIGSSHVTYSTVNADYQSQNSHVGVSNDKFDDKNDCHNEISNILAEKRVFNGDINETKRLRVEINTSTASNEFNIVEPVSNNRTSNVKAQIGHSDENTLRDLLTSMKQKQEVEHISSQRQKVHDFSAPTSSQTHFSFHRQVLQRLLSPNFQSKYPIFPLESLTLVRQLLKSVQSTDGFLSSKVISQINYFLPNYFGLSLYKSVSDCDSDLIELYRILFGKLKAMRLSNSSFRELSCSIATDGVSNARNVIIDKDNPRPESTNIDIFFESLASAGIPIQNEFRRHIINLLKSNCERNQTNVAEKIESISVVKEINVSPCLFFVRFGNCREGESCRYSHDPAALSICPEFLNRICQKSPDDCPLLHELNPVCFIASVKHMYMFIDCDCYVIRLISQKTFSF